jgi:hypothetical protein
MPRKIYEIAADIQKNWPNPYFGAVPYIKAMHQLSSIDDVYFADDARYIVTYFLGNAQTWRGPEARRIKAEIKALAGIK